ncbi:uncharacterized protein LOC122858302 isoform X2 [Aphidius gifuensis]|uniref:uncharacterized protein LOC122858302 isoform X2 n=1 Tax=Aphidius gifuensis TaxID=684658 RepID=UPI001CDCB237|nr:uncharacterized protein LOC122858302 isoform X2 [Aphidius gifuensis]
MSGIMRIGLRHVGTPGYITNNNPTKYLQSMCHMRNGLFNHVPKNSFTSAQRGFTGYWKMIKTVARKSWDKLSGPTSIIIIGYCSYKMLTNRQIWTDSSTTYLNLDVDNFVLHIIHDAYKETLNYSMNPAKNITSSVLFNDVGIAVDKGSLLVPAIKNNTNSVIKINNEETQIEEPKLESFKLTVQAKNSDVIYTFHHTMNLKVKKVSETLQNESAADKQKQPLKEIIPLKVGKFNVLTPGITKTILLTSESLSKWTTVHPNYRPDPDEGYSTDEPSIFELHPKAGKSYLLYNTSAEVQKDDSDEVFHFNHLVTFECEKNSDEKQPLMLAQESEPWNVILDTGTILFKTQDGEKFAMRKMLNIKVFEDGEYTYLEMSPNFSYGSLVSRLSLVKPYLSKLISPN